MENDGYIARGLATRDDVWFPTIYSDRVIRPGAKILVDFNVYSGGSVKLGVSLRNDTTSSCFSDTADGWSYYVYNRSTRHASGSSGDQLFNGRIGVMGN